MNYWILAASGLTFLTMGVHVFAGGPEVHKPTLRSELPRGIKAVVSVIWHGITAILGINAIGLGLSGLGLVVGMLPMVMAQFMAFSGLFLFYGERRMGSMFYFPQWYVFLALAGLTAFGYWWE